jgi:hypothetical protein
MINTDYITLEMKPTTVQLTTVSYWILNNEIQLTSEAGFDKIGIWIYAPTVHAIILMPPPLQFYLGKWPPEANEI